MQKIVVVMACVVLLMGVTGTALATIITVELPGFVGELQPHPNEPTAVFDLGTSFLEINEVHIRLVGTFVPGIGNSMIGGEVELTPEIDLYMDAGVGSANVFVYPLESPFDIEGTLVLKYGATWDFLLDGTDEVTATALWGLAGGGVTITEGSVDISEAYLTVEGVIPEPASVVLWLMSVIMVQVKRGRCERRC